MNATTLLEKIWLLLWSITTTGCALGVGGTEEVLFAFPHAPSSLTSSEDSHVC